MSDLFEVREKVEKGANQRSEINVEFDGDVHSLTVRQLVDTEFWEVMTDIDTDELDSLQTDLPEEKMEEFRDLQTKDSLDEDEEERLEELQNEVETEDINIFEKLSTSTYNGIKNAAKYGVEPDESDIQKALAEHAAEVEEQYGDLTHDSARKYVNDHVIHPMIENSTNFVSFAIGVRALGETLGDAGN